DRGWGWWSTPGWAEEGKARDLPGTVGGKGEASHPVAQGKTRQGGVNGQTDDETDGSMHGLNLLLAFGGEPVGPTKRAPSDQPGCPQDEPLPRRPGASRDHHRRRGDTLPCGF